jgi:type IV pilus assembly protein PilY1
MKRIRLLLMIILLSLFLTGTSLAHDTDLYLASGEGVEPNILIIFDNSISMNGEVRAYYYDPSIDYEPLVVPLENRDTVYYSTGWGAWTKFKDSISEVVCTSAQTALTNNGHYEGYTDTDWRGRTCRADYQTLRTGNYRNYLESIGGDEYLPKLRVAKDVIEDFLDTINGVRVGVMIFNHDEGGYFLSENSKVRSLDDTTRSQLKEDVEAISGETYTPLAETLYEAGLYFKGMPSYFNSGANYTSPIQYSCQKNYVILITDGEPTYDINSVLKDGATVTIEDVTYTYPAIGDQDGDRREPGMTHDPHYSMNGSDYLDDVAKYLYDNDIRSDLTDLQNIITYTIGFTVSSSLLERTATHGHGRYFYSQNAQELSSAFQNVIGEILAKSTSFVAPIVPVSRLERTTAGDKIYLAFFKPIQNKMWSGNIKKFGVQQSDDPDLGLSKGDIVDSNGLKALDSHGQFYSTARSFWTTAAMDGGEVHEGGVGEVLMNRTAARDIYTYFYSDVTLKLSSNAFTTANASITPTVLGLLEGDTDGRDKLINFVRGIDAYDDNNNGNTTEKRDWMLGSFLHSRPLIIHYTTTRSVIFAGSNDGMLHAFDDSDGRELWGFIPPVVLNKLSALHADVIEIYVDGTPRAHITYDSNGHVDTAILIFGLRRGGTHYYALDISDPDNPKFLWEIGPTTIVYETTVTPTNDYQQLGESWASPIVGKIGLTSGDKWVAFIGGGFDTTHDNDPVIASDSMGRAVYVVDVLNGALVKRFSIDDSGYSDMTYAIPSDISKVDTDGNGMVDRLYVGDLGGQLWRFDIGDSDVSQWTGKVIFRSNPGADGSIGRKIFYAPDVTLEMGNYEMLFFGTGDRENPKNSDVINRLYAVKDKNPAAGDPYEEATDLVDVTNGVTDIGELSAKNGWYIILEHASEKCLASPVVFFKAAYFTTFTASSEGIEGDPCYVGEGTARLYVVKYDTGNAVFNFDLTNDVEGTEVLAESDRSLVMGTAMPSGVIITFIGGTAVAYAGVGGGVYTPSLSSTRSLVPMNWRVLF